MNTIDSISKIGSELQINDTGAREIPLIKSSDNVGFAETLKNVLNEASDKQDIAADYIGRFTRGEPVELHQVMAAAEEASISIELLVEVRNKFLDAYRTIVNMQS